MSRRQFTVTKNIKNADSNKLEYSYLQLCEQLLNYGDYRKVREHYCYADFGAMLKSDIVSYGNRTIQFPLLTYRKVGIKNVIEEMLWIIRGDVNSENLERSGVYIWSSNTTLEFLKKKKIDHIVKEKYLGPMYGFTLRCFGAPWVKDIDTRAYIEQGIGVDQLKDIVNKIRTNKTSRNILMTTYNPAQVNLGCLYPCTGIVIQFFIKGKKLYCSMYQRSCDMLIGVPHNVVAYIFLGWMIAEICDLEFGGIIVFLGDYHIYDTHVETFTETFEKEVEIYAPARIHLKKKIYEIEDIERLTVDDFELTDYNSNGVVKYEMLT